MTKQIIPILVLTFITVLSCSEEAPKNDAEVKTEQENSSENTAEAVIADEYVDLDIDGMVCKMGCGGSIRKELRATGGVEKVEFDFSEERKTNFAKVYFDSKKINVDEIVKVVSEINDGQFTVAATGTGKVEVESSEETESTESNDVKVNAYSSSLEMPNIFDLISSLL